jgi:hypothetical protein
MNDFKISLQFSTEVNINYVLIYKVNNSELQFKFDCLSNAIVDQVGLLKKNHYIVFYSKHRASHGVHSILSVSDI